MTMDRCFSGNQTSNILTKVSLVTPLTWTVAREEVRIAFPKSGIALRTCTFGAVKSESTGTHKRMSEGERVRRKALLRIHGPQRIGSGNRE
ncbi:hypothetical protein FRC14_000726 [Serendipita sp. 396]|nr:hypothetical protein FRC14_000726 [Serendipita sp. 396]